ncbi:MAG: hypothetical protein L6R48_17775 [Planctomycetes bacterium]|nr:hypothetical protein [Planctomycetota bacterium]
MAHCIVCREPFTLNPLGRHFRRHTCSACGGLVGDGCYERVGQASGHDAIVCRTCEQAGRAPSGADTLAANAGREAGAALAAALRELREESLDQAGEAFQRQLDDTQARARAWLAEASTRLDGHAADAERRARLVVEEGAARLRAEAERAADDLQRRSLEVAGQVIDRLDQTLERRGRQEIKAAAWLVLILCGGVLATGLCSLLVAWLHRVAG